MRSWIVAACFAALVSLLGPAPASALDACWPQCMFKDGASSAPAAKSNRARSERQADSSRAQKRKSARSSETAFSDERPQRRSRTKPAPNYAASSVGSGGGATGIASYYWQPQRVAAGGWFNPNAMTAAHKTLPFGTRVRVTHLGNGRSVEVTINDRGPYIAGRIIDLSKAAAGVIGMQGQGIANVRMDVLGR